MSVNISFNQFRHLTWILFVIFTAWLCPPQISAQPSSSAPDWSSVQFLLGEWTGEGSGDPGMGNGTFTFSFDLQEHVIIRRNQSDYPATKTRAAISHHDLMIMYQEPGNPVSAIYFDNEGHTIRYRTAPAANGKSITFTSDSTNAGPRFRLTYKSLTPESLLITFEMAPASAPNQFSKYLEGRAYRSGHAPVDRSEEKKK